MESPSIQQRKYVASICEEYRSINSAMTDAAVDDEVSCSNCVHWHDGSCKIFDKELASTDQT